MMILITYDVNTETKAGRTRLRKIAKLCVNYGQRVQNSVFECIISLAKFKEVQAVMIKTIDLEKDSLRFYFLGQQYETKIEHYGAKPGINMDETLML